MIAWLAKWLVEHELVRSRALASFLVKLGLSAILLGGLTMWLNRHDRGVIATHETKRRLEETTHALERQRQADVNAASRDQARAAASAQTQKELETIHAQDPAAAAASASRGTRAVARRLPRQD